MKGLNNMACPFCMVDANNHTANIAPGYQPLNSQLYDQSYTYDQLNRLTKVTDAQNHAMDFSLRTLDAIHLAIAWHPGFEHIATADKLFAKAVEASGFTVKMFV